MRQRRFRVERQTLIGTFSQFQKLQPEKPKIQIIGEKLIKYI